ncbi:nitroreductase [Paenibacillus sp. N1-5-1-14]|uniref:nitroreductase family protein n=1 Tax=Paenibacillus radicibacter TaxID=2972488 RepID=UPI0021594EAC|nr:nitroreductase [Paenibacillus radicibacter]MCR8641804.1 nitroreductase [Paenibacillus radicibacter]
MNIKEAIQNRRSIGKVKPDAVDTKLIEELLEAATWAPNHKKTEPWRFFVMTGEGRNVLGQAYADIAYEGQDDELVGEQLDQFRAKHAQKAFRSPVVIAIAATPTANAAWIEEMAAAHAAVQNMLLTAHSLGLGAVWRTGDPTYHDKMSAAFGLNEGEQFVGFVYVGYPDMDQPLAKRVSFADKTVWLDA